MSHDNSIRFTLQGALFNNLLPGQNCEVALCQIRTTALTIIYIQAFTLVVDLKLAGLIELIHLF